MQPPCGDPWKLGHGLANRTSWYSWSSAPSCTMYVYKIPQLLKPIRLSILFTRSLQFFLLVPVDFSTSSQEPELAAGMFVSWDP